ncbi:Receptor-like serine/threonine-protein kinase [Quillaja saponaria]|uniref:Receptor-like serine/threonine-protein kinase n=1 Tax=Quillaja saponaria TaxID=32244 RepID=A0AAD7LPQ1_QUISA|nr:Receptor-like serine/threonine-protein kinase [Quillaja saponaria]
MVALVQSSPRLQSQHVVFAIDFSSDTKRRRFLLIYELMQNGNLQDACPELMDWKKRFAVVVDIAKEIQCESRVLGVDKCKMNGELGLETNKKDELDSNDGVTVVDCGSMVEETESVNSCYEELSEGLKDSFNQLATKGQIKG